MKISKNIFYTIIFLFLALNAQNKMPVQVSSVRGKMPREYQIVNTNIQQDPAKRSDPDNKPIVTRGVKGKINNSIALSPVNEMLTVPQVDISLSAGAFPDIVSKIAGTIDPRAGVAAAGASAAVNEALRIASNELNKKYKIDHYTINLVEILPSNYYRIDTASNTIKVTPAFKDDLKKYLQVLKEYVPAANSYNKALNTYQSAYTKWVSGDPLKSNAAKKAEVSKIYEKTFKPAQTKKLNIESKLGTYGLHRISLMAVQGKPGEGCSAAGGKGPWSLYLYYFIGAKQTNVFKIDYCVPATGKMQKIDISLHPNLIDASGNFKDGGSNIKSVENITFPVSDNKGGINFGAKESKVYSWFDQMVENKKGNTIETYMFPFDIYNLQAEADKERQQKQTDQIKQNLEKLDAALNEIKSGSGLNLADKLKPNTTDIPLDTDITEGISDEIPDIETDTTPELNHDLAHTNPDVD